ncbi:MAG: cell division regulator GpsB [Bacillaceae bacterium]
MLPVQKNLTAQQILEKDFKVGMRGYNQEEVDKYLDLVIRDYEAYENEMAQLKKELVILKQKLSEQPPTRPTVPVGNTNPDILRRLSNLEKHVFGSKLFEEE